MRTQVSQIQFITRFCMVRRHKRVTFVNHFKMVYRETTEE